ncbi:YIP1 family protein [Deinococcus sp. SL84]|uniref:YIP1 family protein n=1 Tax=Deinococcus sp. SL84 TaxID=2994663 RepID=UPI0022759C7B|nr:YIP1 family protein [Deinococcus sp. SL84]MCY1704045.1 YIP1 family protein [Deinococcus sp. SL84]
MTLTDHIRRSVGDEMQQSLAVLTRPSVRTFELFERKGGVNEALMYVLLASIVSAAVAGLMAFIPWHADISPWVQFVNRLVGIPIQFAIFTGVVYWVGKQFFGGTGRYAEVAYTFALFFVPLSLLSSALGWIPVLGFFVSLLISLALIYYGYLAVQSSMNIRQGANPAITLLVAALVTTALNFLVFGNWWQGF